MGEPEPITSEYDTLTFGEGEEARVYAQVPVERTVEGEVATTRYRLDRLHEEGGGNGLLVALGITAIASAYVVDLLHGIHMIELKKDRVHFKYGKRPGPWKLQPTVDVNKRGASGGLKMQMNF